MNIKDREVSYISIKYSYIDKNNYFVFVAIMVGPNMIITKKDYMLFWGRDW